MNAEAKTYENDKYSFEYPNGCKLEKKENRFSTANAILECKGNAGLQFESDEETSATMMDSSDDELVDSMQTVFESTFENTNVVESGTDKYIINNHTAPYIIGSYDQEYTNFLGLPADSEPFVLMYVMIDIGDEKVLVQYRNSEDSFDKQLPMVEKIFQSVEGLGNRTAIAENNADTDTKTYNFDDDPEFTKLCNEKPNQEQKAACDLVLKLEQLK
jgi:hypothetical protein